MAHGWEGMALKAFGGRDHTLTVTGRQRLSEHMLRLHLTDGGLLGQVPVHPTMWVRLWFVTDEGRHHQRAYTLVDPDPTAGTLALDVHLHDGTAARWARSAQPGDTIEATVQGTGFTAPDPAPAHLHLVGDAASLPAIRTLLAAMPQTPATIWLEHQHEDEREMPLASATTGALPARHHTLHRVPRGSGPTAGERLAADVEAHWAARAAAAGTLEADWFWVAAEAATTRRLSRWLRKEAGVSKKRIDCVAYWKAA